MISVRSRRQRLNGSKKNSILLFSLLLIGLLASCSSKPVYQLSQGRIFHTSYHIQYEYSREIGSEIKALLDSFDLSQDAFNPRSIIARVNKNEPVEVDDWFITVFNKAREVSIESNGLFDITCAPLVNLWGFGFSKIDRVTPEIIDSLKTFVGYQKVRLEGKKVIKDDPRLMLNTSAIAKGYSCDVIAGFMDSLGIKNYMIEIGGEIRVQGLNQKGECWKVEISKPDDDQTSKGKARQAVIQLCNRSLATSGNYRNFYVKNGKKYAHTIDPTTGYPSEQNILSATVITSDCITADAYATAFMALGLEEACRLADRLPDLSYYFIYSDSEGTMQVKHSPDLGSILK